LDLSPTGFHSVIFHIVFVFAILSRYSHHFIYCALMYLTVSSPLINFPNSSSFLFLHHSSVWTGPYTYLLHGAQSFLRS
jgi:hypothetical protein